MFTRSPNQNQTLCMADNHIERSLTLNSVLNIPEIGLQIVELLRPDNLTYAVLPEFRPELAGQEETRSTSERVPAGWRTHRRVQTLGRVSATYIYWMPELIPPAGRPIYLEHNSREIDRFRPFIASDVLTPRVDHERNLLTDSEAEDSIRCINTQARSLTATLASPSLLHVVNFGLINPQRYAVHAENCTGIVYQTPTWDAREVDNYSALLDSVPHFRCWVLGAVVYAIAGLDDIFDAERYWGGLYIRRPEPLLRLEAIANQVWVLPPPVFAEEEDHPEAYAARQFWIRNKGFIGETNSEYALRLIVARRLNEPNGRTHVVAACLDFVRDNGLRNLSRYELLTPWEIDSAVTDYFIKIRRGQKPLQALQLLGQVEQPDLVHWYTRQWDAYLRDISQSIGRHPPPSAYWNDDLTLWARHPVYLWHNVRGGGCLRRADPGRTTTEAATAEHQDDQDSDDSDHFLDICHFM